MTHLLDWLKAPRRHLRARRKEARALLALAVKEVGRVHGWSHAYWSRRLGDLILLPFPAEAGLPEELEIEVHTLWDDPDHQEGAVRLLVSVWHWSEWCQPTWSTLVEPGRGPGDGRPKNLPSP